MNVVRMSVVTVLMSMVLVPFAFADNDRDRDENRGKNDDKKSSSYNASISTSTSALQEQIKKLQEMLKNLKNQREALDDTVRNQASTTKATRDVLKEEIKDTKRELKFARSLIRGMKGDDVRDLQELLAQDPSILTSDMITGFFGPKTEEALRKFQKKHGIDAIGVFGPRTQAKILALFAGRELPAGIIKRLGLETSSTTPGQGFVAICHKPIGTTPQSLVIAVPALGAHLNHGDMVGVCPGSGTSTTTPPTADTTAPVISSVNASNVSLTGATIGWTTNEAASGKLFYGTSTPVNFSTFSVLNVGSALTQSVPLSGLLNGTTYYYAIVAKDAAGNTATSSTSQFTTGTPDTTAPTVSAFNVSNIATTSATVSWTTNEAATSKLYVSTTTPVNPAIAQVLTGGVAATSHTFSLTGLTASTTYYIVGASRDAADNVATSSQQSFLTL